MGGGSLNNSTVKTVFDGEDTRIVMFVNQNITATINNIVVQNGGASEFGGGLYNNGEVTFNNSSFLNNYAFVNGAAIYNIGTANLTLNNCLVADNSLGSSNVLYNTGGAVFNLINSIIWSNTSNSIGNNGGTVTVLYSLLEGENPTGTGNIDATLSGFEPLFIDESNEDYRLEFKSPLVGAGLNSANTQIFDLEGNTRVVNSTIDIGPYENQNNTTLSTDKVIFNNVLVSPNPSKDVFNVSFASVFNEVIITITDLTGKVVKRQVYTNADSVTVNLANQPGVYLLLISTSETNQVTKLVKN